ncbi:acetyltransferase, GNAT family [Gottschalkia acidurici 9a]|uniref:Acetyltransferase, GNAT family n=1 Tax=Gottschalkia acidurici (strain ATCC 7906 / DSM 604 / BCRC 14475 / CIP 104303 / KCTC 5404 / NCIMB 10678 / 9a) TaxID=1128398 RepID=K0B291_GOTA9|nr:GNAT family protein [Gottschalkia acidurici]AFS79045.1 acetyltransferase, GNAT family [Gottschalkia acidurici 9a]
MKVIHNNIKGTLNIRKAIKSDASSLIEYLNIIGGDSDFLTFGLDEFEKSIEEEEKFIESTFESKNDLFIIAEINSKIVGNLNFSGGLRKRTAHTGEFGISVLKEYWGKGIGEELIGYLINWSNTTKIIRKINLRVRTDNIRAINLYKKLGFLEEGVVKREFFINGKFYDCLLMGLLIN